MRDGETFVSGEAALGELLAEVRGGVGEDELVAGGGADGGVAVLEPLERDEGEPAVGLG